MQASNVGKPSSRTEIRRVIDESINNLGREYSVRPNTLKERGNIKDHKMWIHEQMTERVPALQCGKTLKKVGNLCDPFTQVHGSSKGSETCPDNAKAGRKLEYYKEMLMLKSRLRMKEECKKCQKKRTKGKSLKQHMKGVHEQDRTCFPPNLVLPPGGSLTLELLDAANSPEIGSSAGAA